MNPATIAKAVKRLAIIRFFPADADARLEIMEQIRRIVGDGELYRSTPEQRLAWLIDTAVTHMREWKGLPELRGLYCTRWKPADGIEMECTIPNFTPEDSRARREEHYRSDENAYHRDRENWYREENWRGRLFQKVREDLDHVQSKTFPGGGDQFRFASTRDELDELQGKLASGRYDERELDEVIAALQRVVQDNRMTPRDRDLLADDLNRLLDFRARHDSYGAR